MGSSHDPSYVQLLSGARLRSVSGLLAPTQLQHGDAIHNYTEGVVNFGLHLYVLYTYT